MLYILIEKNYFTSKKGLPNIYYDVNVVVESLIREDMEDYIKQSQKFSFVRRKTRIILHNTYYFPVPKMNLEDHGLMNYLSGSQNVRTKTFFENNEKVIEDLEENNNTPKDKKLILSLEKILEYLI
jgi:hypothetical protein